jgi:hypothetical protein
MPLRTCVACRRKREKAELLRWVVTGGTARPDPAARGPGRGAYVCRDERCLERLVRLGRKRDWDFGTHGAAFRLAIRGDVVQNVPGETHEN